MAHESKAQVMDMKPINLVAGFLAPHPPIIIPEIGRGSQEAHRTVAALKAAAQDLEALEPETLVIISPHAPAFQDYIYIYPGGQLTGTFAAFGRPDVGRSYVADTEMADALAQNLSEKGLQGGYLSAEAHHRHRLEPSLDHGVLVPLHFLADRLPRVRIVALASSGFDPHRLPVLGQAIRAAADLLSRRTVLIASGDLSHKVNRESPYGSCPEGARFDGQVMAALRGADLQALLAIEPALREQAAECGYRSLAALCGAFEGRTIRSVVYHYEAPYGIGYGVAGLFAQAESESAPVAIARRTIHSRIVEGRVPDPAEFIDLGEAFLQLSGQRAGAFVSLHRQGQLRGCIGTTGPTTASLVAEIIQNAISAATRDPRFDPLSKAELDDLEISVDVLQPAESVKSHDSLDPKVFGVIVRSGSRAGLLLPDLDGIDTVEDQLAIACRKAGIDPGKPYSIERFRVIRHH
jgi:AmmeMemoRadiSam system protein A